MTNAALTQELTEKLGKSTAEGLMTYFETTSKEKAVELATKADVKVAVSESTKEIIKWMFIFWVGQVAVTIGTCLLIFKLK